MHLSQFKKSMYLRVFSLSFVLLLTACDETPVSKNVVANLPVVDSHSPFQVLTYDDYVRATGCKVSRSVYNDSLQTALNYLTFRNDHAPNDELLSFSYDDIDYARRHSRGLFGGLLIKGDIGVPLVCIHSSLARIGKAIGFPEQENSFLQSPWDDVKASPPKETNTAVIPITEFEILSRSDYIAATGCLISPASYHKFHLAFFQHVLGWQHENGAAMAPGNMRAFLQDVYAGRATPDGAFLDQRCLIPAIRTLANDLELLDKNGQFSFE